MSRKAKAPRPTDRDAVFEQVRALLAENYDCGICLCSWEEQGTTYDMDFKFGNSHAARNLAREAEDILWPLEDEEEEEDDEEETA